MWQPEALQRKVVAVLSDQIAQTTPYRLQVHDVTGNFFTHFSLNDVRVRTEGDSQDWLQVRTLKIGISWLALLHKKIEVNHLTFDAPEARLIFPIPSLKKGNAKGGVEKAPWLVSVDLITMNDGRLILTSKLVNPAAELQMIHMNLQARMTPLDISIVHFKTNVKGGTIQLSGHAGWAGPLSADVNLSLQDVPLHRLAETAFPVPKALTLMHSGEWSVQGSGEEWSLQEKGTLDGSPLAVKTRFTRHGAYEAQIVPGTPPGESSLERSRHDSGRRTFRAFESLRGSPHLQEDQCSGDPRVESRCRG